MILTCENKGKGVVGGGITVENSKKKKKKAMPYLAKNEKRVNK